MADTIITNTPGDNGGGMAGWIVALIVIVAVLVIGLMLYRGGMFNAPAPAEDSASINITLPTPAPSESSPE